MNIGEVMKKKKQVNVVRNINKVILFTILFFIVICAGFFTYIYFEAPEFNSNLLYKKESSNIYDSNGELIATIGTESM